MKGLIIAVVLLSASTSFAWKGETKMPDKQKLKTTLTPLQYKVTQEEGTEPPFNNEYWDNKAEGIYVDIVSGEPLFSSLDKFDSGTGWPSFTKPLVKENIVEKEDRRLFSVRTEVRSKHADSHLGHVFNDGPKPTGLRYCMNSAALRFIPKEKLKEAGYEEFLSYFNKTNDKTTHTVAVFAGGCFWCMQPPFDALKGKGVISTRVGYTGGTKENPTYEEVSSGNTGHREAIEVTYDPKKISYAELLDVFWKNVDPLDAHGQFCDKGEQYTSAVFYASPEQKQELEKSRGSIGKTLGEKGKVVTAELEFKKFYPAEDYHQSYYLKNPIRYKFYKTNCGRDRRLKAIWK